MIGLGVEMLHVMQQLVASQHVKQLDVISIIGISGLGKTTLARTVYEDPDIANHFDIRAWCTVSIEYNKRNMLLTILGCMIELTDMIQKMNEVNLSTLLYKQLMGRRYLIVMDDVWEIDAFKFLKVFLPENENGSRILLTSQSKVIGLKTKHHSDLLELRRLTNYESCLLLSKKVFGDQDCPSELCQVGKRIAESCSGLPLAIVVVAGLLANSEAKSGKTLENWEQFAETISLYSDPHDLLVGFEDEMQHVRQQLVACQHFKALDVVSIIGMPGLGKTTLARKVYEDRHIANHFQIRAWCCVSNEYSKKGLILTILGCIIELPYSLLKKNEAELSTLLSKQLSGRRYLVVMDDVWGIDAFEYLKVYLPKNNNGSRIMLTSRNKVIGLKAKHHSDILELRLLTDDESWILLSKKVYRDRDVPLELCQVGKRIAESCKGLPLAVVVVAGLLAKSHKTREFWEEVAENLSTYISHESQAQGMAVLELSYKHLPGHLKPLFLYIGAFPEDREVPIENLIWLWIAEGFVTDSKFGSLEHQAELYLLDLINRNFLMVAARSSNGRVKTCIVHDLLRDMCLLKAKEEHFLRQIHVPDDLPDSVLYQKRLSIVPQRKKEVTPTHLISDRDPTSPNTDYEDLSTISVLLFSKNRSLPLWKETIASVLCDLKLLRILHFESTSIDANRCGNVMMLVHLRYILIQASWTSIPSSISNLRNLETLIVKGLGEVEVPEEIWELVELRHLHVNDRARFSDPSDEFSMLENLETLSTPAIRCGDEEKLMGRVPNVRKIRCIFLESCPRLEYLNQLESFKAIYTGVGRCPGKFDVPSTLKKLSLSMFRLKWEQVSMFQKLPDLEILNLRTGAVDDESWNMYEEDEEGFVSLKVLKLENLNIKRWTACAYNFPCLEKLVLKKCKQLMDIPSMLGEINSLQKIEVLSCSKAAAMSAKCIEEEQKYAGNELLEVHIYSPANMGSSS